MSEQPQSDRLEAVITLPSNLVVDMISAIEQRRTWMAKALKYYVNEPSRCKVLAAADCEAGELVRELMWHRANGKPYRYVTPLTPEEGRLITDQLKGGPGSTHP